MARSWSTGRNVPSASSAARRHGTLLAVGTWPPRMAPSCGYSGMCSNSPLNSPGERTSTSGPLPMCASTCSRNARMVLSSRAITG